jgi:two-component system cell cycle sensor histidine kinase/response regulator CckA
MNNIGYHNDKLIMIVDDDPKIRDILKAMLEKYGFNTIDSKDGQTALDQYINHPADLVILDISIPGMSGIQCLEKILSLDQKAKVIISSGKLDIEIPKQVLAKGAKAFLPKPYTIHELYNTVRIVLEENS